jgi:hypothetical protein
MVAVTTRFLSTVASVTDYDWQCNTTLTATCNAVLRAQISQEHKDKFKFDSYVIVAPCEVAAGGGSSSTLTTRDMYFLKYDDEVFVNAAEFHFVVRMPDASSNEGKARPQQCRVVAVLTAAKYLACLAEVESMTAGA